MSFEVFVVAAFAADPDALRGWPCVFGNTDDVEVLDAVNDVVTCDDFATITAAEFHIGFDALRSEDRSHNDFSG